MSLSTSHTLLNAAVLSVALFCLCGCQTMNGDGTLFGNSASRGGGRNPPPNPQAQAAAKMQSLEARLQQTEAKIDEMYNESRQASMATASTAEGQVARINALQGDVNALRQELASLSARQAQTEKTLAELPSKLEKLIAASRPSQSGSSRSSPSKTTSQPRHGSASVGYNHTVESGQTLSEIAVAYGVKVNDIMSENNISDPSKIQIGQVLFIPKK